VATPAQARQLAAGRLAERVTRTKARETAPGLVGRGHLDDAARAGARRSPTKEPHMAEGQDLYPRTTPEIAEQRSRLAPGPAESFRAFSRSVFADGAIASKTKQLIAVAVAHVTQCPYCIRGHTRAALRHGATPEEIMEAIWVAAEMRAGGAFAHSALALDEIAQHEGTKNDG
jgi:AhpD family alkylhydroperoxidase